MVLQNLN